MPKAEVSREIFSGDKRFLLVTNFVLGDYQALPKLSRILRITPTMYM